MKINKPLKITIMINTNTKYNGWSNYATWRIKLEWFDSNNFMDVDFGIKEYTDPYELGKELQKYVEEAFELSGNGFILDYALAFIDDVNWFEIAEHFVSEATQ